MVRTWSSKDMNKPKARLKITLACDKACAYCINKDQDYRERWKVIQSMCQKGQVDWRGFRTIIISGGEPTMDASLVQVAQTLRIVSDGLVPIYLQTNGRLLTKSLVSRMDDDIDGIGLSVHDIPEFRHMLTRWLDIVKIKPSGCISMLECNLNSYPF
jgi:molybdenum cofactor biosynthesis enzyme MoaA